MIKVLFRNAITSYNKFKSSEAACLVKRSYAFHSYESKTYFQRPRKTYDSRSSEDYRSHIKNSLKENNSRMGGLFRADQWTEAVEENRSVFSVFGKKKDTDISTVYAENTGKIVRNGEKESCYEPIVSFKNLVGLDARLKKNLDQLGYDKTTPVQSLALPAIMYGEDVLALAQTGSGKTVAFLLPLLQHLLAKYPQQAMDLLEEQQGRVQFPSGLIIAPTRELVQQIAKEAFKLTYGTPLRVVELFGGTSPSQQARTLANGAHIVAATPGRLLDFLEQNLLSLRACHHLVVDEADRCFDMGFEPQIRRVFLSSPKTRQTLLFSATFASDVRHLANEFLSPSHLQLTIGKPGEVPRTIQHEFVNLTSTKEYESVHQLRYDALCSLLVAEGLPKSTSNQVLIFCQTKQLCDDVEFKLRRSGYEASAIHGDKSQRQRDEVLFNFKSGRCPILIASDVAARGLDIPNVSLVVNYEMPLNLDSYTHRVGRTGRLGRSGRAVTLVSLSSNDATHLSNYQEDLCSLLRNADQAVPPMFHQRITAFSQRKRYNKSDGGRRGDGAQYSYESGDRYKKGFYESYRDNTTFNARSRFSRNDAERGTESKNSGFGGRRGETIYRSRHDTNS